MLGVPKDVLIVVLALLEAVTVLALVVTMRRTRERDEEIRGLRAELASVPVRAQNAAGWAVRQVVDTATRVRQRGLVGGLLMAPLEDLTRWATEDRAAIASVADAEGRVTFLFSDIENSTSLNETLGDEAWVKVLDGHDRVVRQQVARRHGHVVKSQGDGFMIVFPSADAAVAAAVGIQESMGSAGRRLRRTPVEVRIGIHTGTAISRDGDYFGRNVAKTARLDRPGRRWRDPGQRRGRGALQRHQVEHHGECELKGLAGTHHVWTVT